MRDRIGSVLGAGGALAEAVPDFRVRPEQQAMTEAVADAVDAETTLVVEAGTGIGKTFAYLVPALLSGRRVIISTGTRTLQDQLYHKDLPLVAGALGDSRGRFALLKGRTNYLCLYRMELSAEEGRFDSVGQAAALQRVRDWSTITTSGDLAEAPVGSGDPGLLGRITSTTDNCLGQECPLYSECFLMEARRRAQEAEVVVVNHHLLMADWAIRRGGFGEVLPRADVYILDEAHQLPDTAARFFGVSVTSRQLLDLARDARIEQLRDARDSPQIAEAAERLQRYALDLRLCLGPAGRRAPWSEVAEEPPVTEALDVLIEGLTALHETLAPQAQRGRGLESCWRRAAELRTTLSVFLVGDAERYAQWFETYTQAFALRLTPLEVADTFREHMQRHPGAWIFTSATLTVDNRFDHYRARLGLTEPSELRLESPFDYRRNALLLLPRGLPAPNAPVYLDRYLEVAARVLRASGGRAFLLFTSHRALRLAANRLRQLLPFPLLVQGEASQTRLLEYFRERGDAVLLGTQSFWEGVDVRGEALSVVMIDRLPFASPGDPVTRARIDSFKRQGGNPFVDFQLPHAVITLRQGVGRLIRDVSDRGVLVIGDGRLTARSYGRVFLDSLPPIPVTRRVEDVESFFAEGAT